jgi:hypothetical protein
VHDPRIRENEPLLGRQILPEYLVPLASVPQDPEPLPLNLTANPPQGAAAIVEPEVLVEAVEHGTELDLMIPDPLVHMGVEPLVDTVQELATALDGRDANDRVTAFQIPAANMLEAQKGKRLGLLPAKFLSSTTTEDQ